jgi:hypothetical protein
VEFWEIVKIIQATTKRDVNTSIFWSIIFEDMMSVLGKTTQEGESHEKGDLLHSLLYFLSVICSETLFLLVSHFLLYPSLQTYHQSPCLPMGCSLSKIQLELLLPLPWPWHGNQSPCIVSPFHCSFSVTPCYSCTCHNFNEKQKH